MAVGLVVGARERTLAERSCTAPSFAEDLQRSASGFLRELPHNGRRQATQHCKVQAASRCKQHGAEGCDCIGDTCSATRTSATLVGRRCPAASVRATPHFRGTLHDAAQAASTLHVAHSHMLTCMSLARLRDPKRVLPWCRTQSFERAPFSFSAGCLCACRRACCHARAR